MRRESPAALALAACLLAAGGPLALCRAEDAPPGDWIDDREIRDRFVETLAGWHETGLAPDAARIRRQLWQLSQHPRAANPNSHSPGARDEPSEAPAPAPAEALDPDGSPLLPLEALYAKAREATLVLGHLHRSGVDSPWQSRLASAVAVGPDLVLTCHHVLDSREALLFGAMTFRGEFLPLEAVLAASRRDDLALVRLRTPTPLPGHLPLAGNAATGQGVVLVSHPDSHFFSLSTGIVSRRYRDPQGGRPRLQITAPFARGSSGAGVLNRHGELVGLASATKSIYYRQEAPAPEDLQMVIHSAAPPVALRALLLSAGLGESQGD